MDTKGKKQILFRWDKNLIEMVKEKAKAQNRSLNNYVETLLYNDIGKMPNETTKKAIEEAMNGINLVEIDDLDSFFNEIEAEVKEQ